MQAAGLSTSGARQAELRVAGPPPLVIGRLNPKHSEIELSPPASCRLRPNRTPHLALSSETRPRSHCDA